jgi:hypothetical protein
MEQEKQFNNKKLIQTLQVKLKKLESSQSGNKVEEQLNS